MEKVYWPFEEGDVEIWYQTPKYFQDHAGMDTDSCDPENLEATHTLLGKCDEHDLEKVFYNMQGEIWSPEGEARDTIRIKGLAHTSMMMGDVVKRPDGVHVVDFMGFKKLN
jgi:hypothetical protein